MSGATIIDVGLRIRGELSGPGDVQVRGHFEGSIHVSGSLWIDDGGVVVADVVAGRVRVDGRLEGRVRASRQVSIGPRGTLVGDVWGLIAVDEGGVFQGHIVADDDAPAAKPSVSGTNAPRALRVEADDGGPLRLPTKRRVTQPSADQTAQSEPHARRAAGTSGRTQTVSDRFATLPDLSEGAAPTAAARTPRRLLAIPREPLVPTPLFDEPPPAAPSTARLPRVTAEDMRRRAATKPPSTQDTTDRQRTFATPAATKPPPIHDTTDRQRNSAQPGATQPPPAHAATHRQPVSPLSADPQPRLPGKRRPAPRREPGAQSPVRRPPPAPQPTAPPTDDTLAESWFEEPDFLVKRAVASGGHPAADEKPGRPAGRKPPPKKKKPRSRGR